ncbi:MAG: phycobilisome rod-core linker polypeptide [Pseudanabaenaceae cyanobacterium SKYGB_i_bin29]|nr:phycobilisome rod-core linker polypeptide [Pseudanabaenaceae cyanobacterium SKYG29]MDW8422558.1 phycobilisome rod-core linker polypeptide [Pseudanabaenaceae cyanobacterium SKYGB_i_bin29]
MALWITNDRVELTKNATEEDLQVVIRAVYRQVLSNAHILESERLTTAESMLRNGDITVRGFVRAVGLSDLYRRLFFETSSPYRFVELNFKHFLGRAPQDQAEVAEHVRRYSEQGYEAEINSYIDSPEYQEHFGENVVPYMVGSQSQVGVRNVVFNRTFALVRGFAADTVGKDAKLISDIGIDLPTKIVPPARGSGAYSNTGKRFRITASKSAMNSRRSITTTEVGYNQLSDTIQNIQRGGGRIISIKEVA